MAARYRGAPAPDSPRLRSRVRTLHPRAAISVPWLEKLLEWTKGTQRIQVRIGMQVFPHKGPFGKGPAQERHSLLTMSQNGCKAGLVVGDVAVEESPTDRCK